MNFAIVGIMDRGVPNKERLVLKALLDTQLEFFVILDTVRSSPTTISNTPRHTFWFPSKLAKAGDLVMLYTGPGIPQEFKQQDASTLHVFHWGINKTLWNDPNGCAVVMTIAEWQSTN